LRMEEDRSQFLPRRPRPAVVTTLAASAWAGNLAVARSVAMVAAAGRCA